MKTKVETTMKIQTEEILETGNMGKQSGAIDASIHNRILETEVNLSC